MSFFCAFFWSVVCLFLVSNFPLTEASPDIQQLKGSNSFQRGHLAETPEGETIASCEAKETINAAVTALQKAQQEFDVAKNAKTDADDEYEKVKNVKSEISQNIADAKSKWESAKKAIRAENIPASVSRTITSAEGSIKQAESKMAEITSFTEMAEGNKTKAESEIQSIDKKLKEANGKLNEGKEKCKSSAEASNGNKATLNNGASQDASSVTTLAGEIEGLAKTASESIDHESRFAKNARYTKASLQRFLQTLDGDTTALPNIYATALKKEKTEKEINLLSERADKALKKVEKTVTDINSTVAAIQVLLNEMGTLTTPCAVTELETQKEEAKRQFLKAQSALQQAETEKEKVKEAVTNVTKASSEISASFSSKSPEELAQSATKAAEEAANAEQSATSQVIAANAALNAAQSALTNAKKTHSTATESTCKANKKEEQTVNPLTIAIDTPKENSKKEDVSKKNPTKSEQIPSKRTTGDDKAAKRLPNGNSEKSKTAEDAIGLQETGKKVVKKVNTSRGDFKPAENNKRNKSNETDFTNGPMYSALTHFALMFSLFYTMLLM